MRRILDTGVICIVPYDNYEYWPFIIRNHGIYDSEFVACRDINMYNPCILHTEIGCKLPDIYCASGGLLYIKKDGYHKII